MLSLSLALLLVQQPAYMTPAQAQAPAPGVMAPIPDARGGYRTGAGTPPSWIGRQAPTPSTMAPIPDAPDESGYRVAPSAPATGYATTPPPTLARTGVTLEAYDKRVESRWGVDDPYYNSTVRGGEAAAQSRQGPLDGGWTITGQDGRALYALQLADSPDEGLQGAWREMVAGAPAAPRPNKSGFIALITRGPGPTVLRFLQPGAAAPTTLTLSPALDGTWRGEVADATGRPAPVVMRRR